VFTIVIAKIINLTGEFVLIVAYLAVYRPFAMRRFRGRMSNKLNCIKMASTFFRFWMKRMMYYWSYITRNVKPNEYRRKKSDKIVDILVLTWTFVVFFNSSKCFTSVDTYYILTIFIVFINYIRYYSRSESFFDYSDLPLFSKWKLQYNPYVFLSNPLEHSEPYLRFIRSFDRINIRTGPIELSTVSALNISVRDVS